MKSIHASRKLLFINLLCLLWLPNYCDIKQNEGDSQGIPMHTTAFSDPSGTKNVPSKQEKENYIPNLKISEKKVIVQPNVEYVNSVDKDAKVEISDVESLKSPPQPEKVYEEISQQLNARLESSRLSSIKVKDKESMFNRRTAEHPDQPKLEFTEIYVAKPEVIKPTLSAPVMETSVIEEPIEKFTRIIEAVPKSAVPGTAEADSLTRKEKAPEHPQVPLPAVHDRPVPDDHMHPQPHYDGMPSFDEWKKMMLAEQEKGGQKVPSPTPPGKKISSQKRRRNYSSFECGAKIVASNTEAEGTSRILNELVDEYMLNPCKAKIWFVIELCETVQASQIELANFELFSSCPKDFTVYSSDNFPTRDWALLGTFAAAEQRVLQSFELKQEGFGKFIKIELQSYYGKEHYCPLSVVRIFGTSMVDEYEEMETLASHSIIQEDDLDRLDISLEDKKTTNLFGSATDAVIHIMKKAAQALGQHQPLEDGQSNETIPDQQNISKTKVCKMAENSSDECVDVPIKVKSDNLPTLQNFSHLPSSIHHSLFRLLHRCDQCVSSQIRYYSSAQPHCRFFQAAFGPIVFQNLCDWFREHPLVFAHESSAHSKEIPHESDLLMPTPTKSPPPQIMIVPVENDAPIKELVNDSLSYDSLEDTDSVNATEATEDITYTSEVISSHVQLESSIMPTHTQKAEHTVMLNSSIVIVDSGQIVLPSADKIRELPRRPTIVIPNETDVLIDKSLADTVSIDASVADLPAIGDVYTDVEEEQMKEYLLDPGSVTTEEIGLSDTITVAADGKPVEDRASDLRSETQGKLEPVVVSTAGQKESVFMRMSNRIKSLELNMSLSSQYLQELSQRYRRQMEEMQRAFNRTIGTLNDTAKKAAERDIRQQEILNTLQMQVSNLTETVEILLNERSSVFRQMIETHVCLMVVEAIIMITVMSLCVRRISSSAGQVPQVVVTRVEPLVAASPRLSKRRSSVDSCTPPVARKVKKRSASEEALNAGEDLLIIEPLPVFLEPILKAKKKNRKRSKVQRSVSNPTVQRRDLSPSSQSVEKRISYSEGCMLKNGRARHPIHRKNHACENCNEDICTEVKSAEKDRKLNGTPLQNLTNGTSVSYQKTSVRSQRAEKGKEKFSFRKFLKFQKRDSI